VRIISAGDKDLQRAQAWSQIAIPWLEGADTRFTALFINLVRAKKPLLLAGGEHTAWVDKHRKLGLLE
jgi:hypothetical protein